MNAEVLKKYPDIPIISNGKRQIIETFHQTFGELRPRVGNHGEQIDNFVKEFMVLVDDRVKDLIWRRYVQLLKEIVDDLTEELKRNVTERINAIPDKQVNTISFSQVTTEIPNTYIGTPKFKVLHKLNLNFGLCYSNSGRVKVNDHEVVSSYKL
jgi:hypothetical protein